MDEELGPIIGVMMMVMVMGMFTGGGVTPEPEPPKPPDPPGPGLANLYGRLSDSSTGAPIASAHVALNGLSTETDAKGDYVFRDKEQATYDVEFSKSGYESLATQVTLVEGNNELSVLLIPTAVEPTTNLTGHITDKGTGQPLSYVSGTLYQDHNTHTDSHNFTTDVNGYYTITDLLHEVDQTQLVIYAGGYQDYTNSNVAISEGNNVLDIELEWAGGDRNVPRYVSCQVPSQITSGQEFPVELTVDLPYTEWKYYMSVKLGRWSEPLEWKMFFAESYDTFRPGYLEDKGYIRLTDTGLHTFEGTMVALERAHYHSDLEPVPPGIYDIIVDIERSPVEANSSGTFRSHSCPAHPACWFWGPTVVGTVEVVGVQVAALDLNPVMQGLVATMVLGMMIPLLLPKS